MHVHNDFLSNRLLVYHCLVLRGGDSCLKDRNENILIEGFYDHVIDPGPEEMAVIERVPIQEGKIKWWPWGSAMRDPILMRQTKIFVSAISFPESNM